MKPPHNLLKTLNEDGTAIHMRGFQWNLPRPHQGKFGMWMPKVEGGLVVRDNGYHLCTWETLLYNLGTALYSAQARGRWVEGKTEVVVEQARLLAKVPIWDGVRCRLFALDCVLHICDSRSLKDVPEIVTEAWRLTDRARTGTSSVEDMERTVRRLQVPMEAHMHAWSGHEHGAFGVALAAYVAFGDSPWGAAWHARMTEGNEQREHEWQKRRLSDHLNGEI